MGVVPFFIVHHKLVPDGSYQQLLYHLGLGTVEDPSRSIVDDTAYLFTLRPRSALARAL
jgi:hypothetical protein